MRRVMVLLAVIFCVATVGVYADDTALTPDNQNVINHALSQSDMDALCSQIDTSGEGSPVIVFNTLPWARTESVSVESPFPGEDVHVGVTDKSGEYYPARTLGDVLTFTARNVPAMGYKVFWAHRVLKPVPGGVSFTNSVLENQFFRVHVDSKLGVITGIYDKINKRSVTTKPTGILQMFSESNGLLEGPKKLIGSSEVVCSDCGPAKVTVWYDHKYGKSVFTQELTLYDAVPRIDIKMTTDWQQKNYSLLKAAFSTDLKNTTIKYEAPSRAKKHASDNHEDISKSWIDISNMNYGLSLLNDSERRYTTNGNLICLSLLDNSQSVDPMSHCGIHEITYALFPHKGKCNTVATDRRSQELSEPLIARAVTAHSSSK